MVDTASFAASGPGPRPQPAAPWITAEQRELLDQILDKWSLHVLDRLCERPSRFNELRRALPELPQKSLATTLRRLERNGMIRRDVVSTRPIAVTYRVTALGDTLQPLIEALFSWSSQSLPAVRSARGTFDADREQEESRP
jgi:DNA-binding HxlR family transcriptional regulator